MLSSQLTRKQGDWVGQWEKRSQNYRERRKGILWIKGSQTTKPEERSLYWKGNNYSVKRLTSGLLKAFPLSQAHKCDTYWSGLSGEREAVSDCIPAGLRGTDPPKCHGPGAETLVKTLLGVRAGLGFFSWLLPRTPNWIPPKRKKKTT